MAKWKKVIEKYETYPQVANIWNSIMNISFHYQWL